jgi:hypothetical protein
MSTSISSGCTESADVVDQLNNVLTGIAIKCGVLKSRVVNEQVNEELSELERLAIRAVKLLRQLAPV